MIFKILQEIATTPGMNDKIKILETYKDNENLKKICWYAYSPTINYWVKNFEIPMDMGHPDNDISKTFPLLDDLSNRVYTGNEAKSQIFNKLIPINYVEKKLFVAIINRDLRCGLSIKSINKVWPKLIEEPPYMRCSGKDQLKKIKYPAKIDQKCDGMFVNVIYKEGEISYMTRNGNKFKLKCLTEELLHNIHDHEVKTNDKFGDFVLHGEFLIEGDEGSVEKRKIGNGLINSLIKKEQTLESLDKKLLAAKSGLAVGKITREITEKIIEFDSTDKRIIFVGWDWVTYEGWLAREYNRPYMERFENLSNLTTSSHVKLVDYKIVNSYDEAIEFYQMQIDNGFEGAVLKNLDFYWKSHDSPYQIKLKSEKECELIVTGFEFGDRNTKFHDGIGALSAMSSCGMVRVSVGSGFDLQERGYERVDQNDSSAGIRLIPNFDLNQYTGKIITVRYNELIKSEGKDTWSLFLPRFIEVREDKTEADSFEKIKKI